MLILAAIPLGNPGDASTRLKEAIVNADFIAAEDSRRFGRLCAELGVSYEAKIFSFFEGNENERLEPLLEILQSGKDLLVVTDAGMPGISDPGYRLTREAIARGIAIRVLPGPSAVTTALLFSGLPTDRFCFEGFLPRTSGARITALEKLAHEERTMIFFEAPHRLLESLHDCVSVLGGDRLGAICREMTKTYEETIRGTLTELSAWAQANEILGEITLVIAGFDASNRTFTADELATMVLDREGQGESRKEAIAEVAKATGIAKREVFDVMVAHKSAGRMGS
jgi:16S rRNA (cytidine1402-2'-O)-methyltransferase